MKRAMFTILWAAVFFVATMIVGSIVFPILRSAGIISWPPSATVDMIWAVVGIGSPLVALSLGSRGILPGTKKQSKDEAAK
jgi:hypothetical protein